jgi:hypothetical protein
MGKWKRLDKLKEELGEEEGIKEWHRERAHRRKRTLEIIKTLSGVTLLLKVFGR